MPIFMRGFGVGTDKMANQSDFIPRVMSYVDSGCRLPFFCGVYSARDSADYL